MLPVQLRRGRIAVAAASALAIAACSSSDQSILAPLPTPSILELIPTTSWVDPEAGTFTICKWQGPAGAYTYKINVAGGGDYRLPFGDQITLTSDVPITAANAVCRWVYFPWNSATWAGGKSANVTVTEVGYLPDSIPVVKNGVPLPTVFRRSSVTVSSTYDDVIGVYYFNGTQACGRLYWLLKPGDWKNSGYDPRQLIGSVFSSASFYSVRRKSLLKASFYEALTFRGGPTIDDKSGILLGEAVIALLNADNPIINYAWTRENIIQRVNAALATQNLQTIRDLSATLEMINHGTAGCPLNFWNWAQAGSE